VTFTSTGRPVPTSAPPTAAGSSAPPGFRDPNHDTTTSNVANLDRASSRCAVSDDPTYGFAVANAIKVGGGDAGGPAREVKYLNVLRGPAGQGVHFRRLGSLPAPDRTILDLYELTYDGVDKPLRLYFDEYHFDELLAPMGLVCAASFDLAPPGATSSSMPGVGASASPGPAAASSPMVASPDAAGLTAASSKCAIAEDDAYGLSVDSAIKIGGGSEAAAREQQMMMALRGPAGQGLRFRRVGAMLASDRQTIVDTFELTYAGIAKPMRVYFDRAHAETPKAPKGLACAAALDKEH
jgi:hypothetical protein